jgi:Plasmid pRiA4b ORF-3-like protein
MPRPARTAADRLVSLKVTLRGIRPPIWRRLVIPGTMTLGDLHQAIQAAMGWDDDHLHVFDLADRTYSDPSAVDGVADEERVTLNGVLKSGVTRFTYTYDFGDNWKHIIVIEDQSPPPPLVDGRRYPACVAGKRNCPPEDCGGRCGYQDLLAVLANPAHPSYREWIAMIGEGFDPEDFSVDAADTRVAARFGRK